MQIDFGDFFAIPVQGGRCEIHEYLPGIVCNKPAAHVWGYGSLIKVCEFHGQIDPRGTTDELLAELFELEKLRDRCSVATESPTPTETGSATRLKKNYDPFPFVIKIGKLFPVMEKEDSM